MNQKEIFPNEQENIDISKLSDQEIEDVWMMVMNDDAHSLRKWFNTRGFDIDARFFFPSLMGRPWPQKIQDFKNVIEAVNRVGASNLRGKSFELIPGNDKVGYVEHPLEGYGKQLQLGLDAPVEQLADGIRKYVIGEPQEESDSVNKQESRISSKFEVGQTIMIEGTALTIETVSNNSDGTTTIAARTKN